MSSFVERLILRSSEARRTSEIKPALTPAMLPVSFQLLEQGTPPYTIRRPLQSVKPPRVDENNLPELREITNSREQRVTQPTKTEPSGDTLGQGNTSTSGDSQKKIPPNGMEEAGSVETLGYEENPDQSAKAPSEDRTKLERTQPWNIIPVPLDERGADENITQAQLGEGTIHEKKAMIEESTSPRESKQLSSIRTDEPYEMESGTGKLTSQVTEVRRKESGLEAVHSEPSVTVSIGRIEVRAIMPEKPPTKEQGPTLSLEEYLKRRREART